MGVKELYNWPHIRRGLVRGSVVEAEAHISWPSEGGAAIHTHTE